MLSQNALQPSADIQRDEEFLQAVLMGLSSHPKTLPCRYLYDTRGSELFEEITRLPEYYLTRAEIALIEAHGPEIATLLPEGGVLVEFGSGSSRKTVPLLKAAPQLHAYIPLDISGGALFPAADRVRKALPRLKTFPLLADFTQPVELPSWAQQAPRAGFFPGSTLGNFSHEEAAAFLRAARATLGHGAPFVIGIDLQKPLDILLAAYNDAADVTGAFNRNLLVRINRELQADFDPAAFAHRAVFNVAEGRMEMHLVAARAQTVTVAGRTYNFREGETIHTENSYKYTPDGFSALAERAGWSVESSWLGKDRLFGLFALR